MQQEASRKLGFSASSTMSVAQRLYENGFITYMRTDSTTLSETAISAARSQARDLYGAEYLPDAPRVYASKVKNAQEAHEAIRPAGDSFRTPAQTGLTGDQFRLYELIWMRTIASQMKDAVGNSVTIRLGGAASTGEDVVFSASGRVITFHGFLKAYVEGTRRRRRPPTTRRPGCPTCREGDAVSAARDPRRGPLDQAAGALHRGDPDQGARGARDRPPFDVRLDHRHHPQPRLRLQEGDRARPRVARVLGDPAARGALHPAGLLRVHRPDGGRARRRSPAGAATATPSWPSSTSAAARSRASRSWSPSSATSTPRSWPPSRSAVPTAADRPAGGQVRPLPRGPRRRRHARRRRRPTSPTTCRPTS